MTKLKKSSSSSEIYKNGCWGCKRAWEAEKQGQKYVCPKIQQHWEEYIGAALRRLY